MSEPHPRETRHRIIIGNSQSMKDVDSDSIDLVVTSPPYPMIEMWDEMFGALNPEITEALTNENGRLAFDLMQVELGKTWKEVVRVLKDGAICCVNIGDATRTIAGCFRTYSNHSRATQFFEEAGLIQLPSIIWRKPTNSPNKFMGSGMLPTGAYVTLEQEHILIFRKGERRSFNTTTERRLRGESAYFWEERNQWFSDVWTDLLGTNQPLDDGRGRQRSGAFPFALPYRLINMFSLKDDLVLDPFLGTGTTTLAAIASRRNSVGYEIDEKILEALKDRLNGFEEVANEYIDRRISGHMEFARGRDCGFVNEPHGFRCVSNQETSIRFDHVHGIKIPNPNSISVRYGDIAQAK